MLHFHFHTNKKMLSFKILSSTWNIPSLSLFSLKFYLARPNVVLDKDVGVAQRLEDELKRHLGLHHLSAPSSSSSSIIIKRMITWLWQVLQDQSRARLGRRNPEQPLDGQTTPLINNNNNNGQTSPLIIRLSDYQTTPPIIGIFNIHMMLLLVIWGSSSSYKWNLLKVLNSVGSRHLVMQLRLNIARGTTDPEINPVTWSYLMNCKCGH